MKSWITLLCVCFTVLSACSSTDPTEEIFTSYIMDKLNDPDSYEFVRVDSIAQYRISWEDYLKEMQDGKSKKEARETDKGVKGYSDVWVTYRAKNKLGGTVTTTMYAVIDAGKVISAKKWNEPLPHLR